MSRACFHALLLVALLPLRPCLATPAEPNRIINGDFEKSLAGWTVEGTAVRETTAPLAGIGSLRLGPGKGVIRQRYRIGGLQIVYFGAQLQADSPGSGALVRVQCYDANNRLQMDLRQPLGSKQKDTVGIYFKTQAHTASLMVSIEKPAESTGSLYADSVTLTDYDRERQSHPPTCNIRQYMLPLWNSKIIHNETVILFSQDGKPASGKLLFTPERILSIRDYSTKTTYVRGRDYTVQGRSLVRTANSRMPFLRDTAIPKKEYPWLDLTGKHVVVTYTHRDRWRGPVPAYQGNRLPRTLKKLTTRSPLVVAATGDSITLGNGTSGFTQVPPYMPTWGELFVAGLKQRYSYDAIRCYNTALGGMTSAWGLENADSAVASLNPDLVLIAFGMNDFWSVSPEEFRGNIAGIIKRVRARRPSAEFVLISSMRFDPAYCATDPQYQERLLRYAVVLKALTGDGVALLDMTAISGTLFATKSPKDLLADPLHPNDFLARWYAQGLVALVDEKGPGDGL